MDGYERYQGDKKKRGGRGELAVKGTLVPFVADDTLPENKFAGLLPRT